MGEEPTSLWLGVVAWHKTLSFLLLYFGGIMDELIRKYRKRIRELEKEYKTYLGDNPMKVYTYGKILIYKRVIKDLMEVVKENETRWLYKRVCRWTLGKCNL